MDNLSMKLLLILLPCLLLAGPKPSRYNCPAGQTFDVAYSGNRAEITIPGKPRLKLPSISTFSYSDGFSLLSLKGPEATFASGVITLANAAPAGTHTIAIQTADNCFVITNASFQLTVQASNVFANGFE